MVQILSYIHIYRVKKNMYTRSYNISKIRTESVINFILNEC